MRVGHSAESTLGYITTITSAAPLPPLCRWDTYHCLILDTVDTGPCPAQPGDYARGVSANREMSGVRAAVTSY